MKIRNSDRSGILKLPKYNQFLDYLETEYKPYLSEFFGGKDKLLFLHPFYTLAYAKRFYLALQYFHLYFPKNGVNVLDVGGYPGTMLKLLRKYSTGKLDLYQCGLFHDPGFLIEMESYNIEMLLPVDIDPPAHYKKELEEKHQFIINSANETVDFIVFTEVIEHLVYPLHFLAEAYRILKPGGRIFITTPNIAKSSAWVRVLLGKSNLDPLKQTQIYMNGNWRGHVRLYSKEELTSLLCDLNFNILESTAINNGDYSIQKTSLLRKLDFAIRLVIEFILPWTKPGLLVVAEKPT